MIFKKLYILFIFAVDIFLSWLFLFFFPFSLLQFLTTKAFIVSIVCVVNFFNLFLCGFFKVEFKIFLNFFETSSLTHGLIMRVFFDIQIFGGLSSYLYVIDF